MPSKTTLKNTAFKIAAKWQVTLEQRLVETSRAVIYKAQGPVGPVALKLYKQVGSGGEGAAIQFLRNLAPDVGVKVLRVNLLRTAVMLEWLEGPSLDALAGDADDTQAVTHLAHVAGRVAQTDFNYPFLYRKITTKFQADFQNSQAAATDPDLTRAAHLMQNLVETTTQDRVIHGDLRFENVILTKDGPRLIDPKGYVADPAFEFCKALTPAPAASTPADYAACIMRRAPVYAGAIGTDPKRVIGWGAVVLAQRMFSGAKRAERSAAMRPFLQTFLDLADA